MDKNKLLIPVSIIVGFIIVGWFSSRGGEVAKQNPSVDSQQAATTVAPSLTKEQTDAKTKCESSLKELKEKWTNILGVYYDPQINTCIVKYDKKGETRQSAVEDMHDVDW